MLHAINKTRSQPSNHRINTDKNTIHSDLSSIQQPPKHTIPCPFLRKRGWCAKGNLCDFFHNGKPIYIIIPYHQNTWYRAPSYKRKEGVKKAHSVIFLTIFYPATPIHDLTLTKLFHLLFWWVPECPVQPQTTSLEDATYNIPSPTIIASPSPPT